MDPPFGTGHRLVDAEHVTLRSTGPLYLCNDFYRDGVVPDDLFASHCMLTNAGSGCGHTVTLGGLDDKTVTVVGRALLAQPAVQI